MKRFLHLDALPSREDFGLFVLRVSLGLSMLILHGIPKLSKLTESPLAFPDPLGVGARTSLGLTLFAEVVCTGLLVVGLCGRLAAAILAVTMGVAFFVVHKASTANGGELALIYFLGFIAIFLGGNGALALDKVWGTKASAKTA